MTITGKLRVEGYPEIAEVPVEWNPADMRGTILKLPDGPLSMLAGNDTTWLDLSTGELIRITAQHRLINGQQRSLVFRVQELRESPQH